MSTQKTRPPLNRNLVLWRAIVMADADGLAGVSMRKLAHELGVEAMSLYNHVSSKDDLVLGMIDEVAGQFAVPDKGKWRKQMRKRAQVAHEILMRHPWAAQLILSNGKPGPNMLAYVEATLACLIDAGFSYPQADHVWNALDAYVYGYTIQRQTFPFEPQDYPQVAAANMGLIPADSFPHLHQLAHLVAVRQHNGLQSLEFGLDILLDGMDKLRGKG